MRLLLLTLLCTGVSAVHAEEIPKVSIRMLCLEGTKAPPALLMLTGKQGEKPVETPCRVMKDDFTVPLVIEIPNETVTFVNADDHKPVARVSVPKGLKSVFFLFVTGAKGDEGLAWRIFAFDESLKAIPNGSAYVANLTNMNLQCTIGESKIELKPGTAHNTPQPKEVNNFNMASVMFRFQTGAEWKTVSQTMMPFMNGLRYFIFTYIDSSGGPRIIPYKDILRLPVTPPPIAAP